MSLRIQRLSMFYFLTYKRNTFIYTWVNDSFIGINVFPQGQKTLKQYLHTFQKVFPFDLFFWVFFCDWEVFAQCSNGEQTSSALFGSVLWNIERISTDNKRFIEGKWIRLKEPTIHIINRNALVYNSK